MSATDKLLLRLIGNSAFNEVPRQERGLRKRDIKLIADLFGVEYPVKKKEEKKDDKKKSALTVLEASVILTLFSPIIISTYLLLCYGMIKLATIVIHGG